MEMHRTRLMLMLLALLGLLAIVTSVTYAWFGISRAASVEDIFFTIYAGDRLELAPATGPVEEAEWTTLLDLSEVLEGVVLRPVTWSEREGAFLAPRYGLDGRTDFSDPLRLSDAENANIRRGGEAQAAGRLNYYIAYPMFVRSGGSAKNVLLPMPEVREVDDLGNELWGRGTFVVGRPVWDASKAAHVDAGNGAELSIRIGFRFPEIDGEGVGRKRFVIYEPNADRHLEQGDGLLATPSIDGAGTLVPSEDIIQQYTSTWREKSPILRDEVIFEPAEFVGGKSVLFGMESGEVKLVTLYIWLEGQDIDCLRTISSGQIYANIQLGAVRMDPDEEIEARGKR